MNKKFILPIVLVALLSGCNAKTSSSTSSSVSSSTSSSTSSSSSSSTSTSTSQPSSRMTKGEFEALLDKITNEGAGAEFDLKATSGTTVLYETAAIFNIDVPNLEMQEEQFIGGVRANGTILKDYYEYSYDSKTLAWSKSKDKMSNERAQSLLNGEVNGFLSQFFPSKNYDEYTYNSDGTYTVTGTTTQYSYVFTYVMDKTNISSVDGVMTGSSSSGNIVSHVTTTKFSLGAQKIEAPEYKAPEYKVTEAQLKAALDFDTIRNFELTLVMDGITNIQEQDGYKTFVYVPGLEDYGTYLDYDGSSTLSYTKYDDKWLVSDSYYRHFASEQLKMMLGEVNYNGLVWNENNNYYTYEFTEGALSGEYSLSFEDGKLIEVNRIYAPQCYLEQIILSRYNKISIELPSVKFIEQLDVEPSLSIGIGEQTQLDVQFLPFDSNEKTSFESSDGEIVQVFSDGTIIGIREGEATITVRSYDCTVECTVTVEDGGSGTIYVESVSLDKETLSLFVDDSDKLTATVLPDNATFKDVLWSSSNDEVATVDEDGVVHAVSAGQATITVTTKDGDFTATCTVTVMEDPGTEFSTPDKILPLLKKYNNFVWNNDYHFEMKVPSYGIDQTQRTIMNYQYTEDKVHAIMEDSKTGAAATYADIYQEANADGNYYQWARVSKTDSYSKTTISKDSFDKLHINPADEALLQEILDADFAHVGGFTYQRSEKYNLVVSGVAYPCDVTVNIESDKATIKLLCSITEDLNSIVIENQYEFSNLGKTVINLPN